MISFLVCTPCDEMMYTKYKPRQIKQDNARTHTSEKKIKKIREMPSERYTHERLCKNIPDKFGILMFHASFFQEFFVSCLLSGLMLCVWYVHACDTFCCYCLYCTTFGGCCFCLHYITFNNLSNIFVLILFTISCVSLFADAVV